MSYKLINWFTNVLYEVNRKRQNRKEFSNKDRVSDRIQLPVTLTVAPLQLEATDYFCSYSQNQPWALGNFRKRLPEAGHLQ